MNFDQIIEALGLRKLAAAASSRRTSPGGGGQPVPGAPPQQPGPPEAGDGPDVEPTPDDDSAEDAGSPLPDWGDDEPSEADDDVEGTLQEIRHDLDQIAADVGANDSSIRGIESRHEEVLDRLDSIEEHNSQLLGVYDRLTAGINPFAEGWQARYDRVRENAENAEHRYNVVELPEGEDLDPVAPGSDDAQLPESGAPTDEESVGFEELQDRAIPDETAADSGNATPADGDRPETPVAPRASATVENDAYLGTLSRGYATEVLLMEWLTMLVDIAGPPGALKALDYYENIGWISDPVKHRLEDLLGGARVTEATEPRSPGDLTTEEHNHSFAYIMKLAQEHHSRPNARRD